MATGANPAAPPAPAGQAHRQPPASAEQLRAAIDASPDPVVILAAVRDDDGAVVDLEYRFVNTAALRLYGRPREELVGHGMLELFPSLRDDQRWATYLAVIASGEAACIEFSGFGEGEGEVRGKFALTVAPFEDGLIVTARDVTDQVRAEQQLRSERDVINAVLEVAGAVIVVMDPNGHIVRLNRQGELLSGYRETDIVGRHYEFLVPAAERAQVAERLATVSGEHPVSQVNHYLTKDGEQRLLRWSHTALIDGDRQRTHLVAVGVDITEERRAEEDAARRAGELEVANRELERSNADLGQFAYTASHDLREPLRAISGPLTYIAEHNKGRFDKTTDEFIDFAVAGCLRMQSLIDGLLAYSRIGRAEEAVGRTDSGQAVREAIASLRPILDSSRAVVVTVEPLPIVLADPTRLSQVFQNLIGNAVKFVAPGVVPRVSISATRVGTAWRFDVIDNGIGIRPRNRERVFIMFKRLQALDDYPGSGIGLAVVKKIVEHYGGDVGVEDAPTGTGCRFWFTIPAAVKEAPAPQSVDHE